MPGAEQAVYTLNLHRDAATAARTLLVAFPPGFSRPQAGSYQTTETFLILTGELHIGSQTFTPGDLVRVPAGAVRVNTRCTDAAFAIAWFEGRPEWTPAPSEAPTAPFVCTRLTLPH